MTTRQLQLGCTFRYSSTNPTAAIFQVKADQSPRADVRDERWSWDGPGELHQYRDLFDNPCTRTVLPVGVSTLQYDATVVVPDEPEEMDLDARETPPTELPDDVLVYTLASRFCQPDVLGHQAWRRFGRVEPGYRRVQQIMTFVHEHLAYVTGSTTATATSEDTFTTGMGVCRDFAHLAITFCRAMNIPARYVHGYMPYQADITQRSAMDFHAWTQVFLDGRWWDFDPRWNQRCVGRVIIGKGRDAADVAMATTYGAPWLQLMTVRCDDPTLTL